MRFYCREVESTRKSKLRRFSGRFQTLIWRPGDTVQNLESPGLSGRVDSPELMNFIYSLTKNATAPKRQPKITLFHSSHPSPAEPTYTPRLRESHLKLALVNFGNRNTRLTEVKLSSLLVYETLYKELKSGFSSKLPSGKDSFSAQAPCLASINASHRSAPSFLICDMSSLLDARSAM